MPVKNKTSVKIKRAKSGITFKTVILSSFLFSIIGLLGIGLFVGQISAQISDYRYEQKFNEKLSTLTKEKQKESEVQKPQITETAYTLKDKSGLKINFLHKNKKYTVCVSKDNSDLLNLGSVKQKVELYKGLVGKGYSETVSFNFAFNSLGQELDNIINKISQVGVDAKIKFSPNNKQMFEITPHINNVEVDKNLFFSRMADVMRLAIINKANNVNVELPVVETEPKLTTEILQKAQSLRGEFQTNFAGGQEGRIHNIKHALWQLNGSVVLPGQIFSFNDKTSPHSERNGYSKAKIIVNGEFKDGIGGGICQVSTTLFNSVLMADLTVVKSQNHSLPVGYVKLPFDAMVSSSSDMVFKNTTNAPVCIKAYSVGNDAKIEIYGLPLEDGLEIRRKSVLVETLSTDEKLIKKDVENKYTSEIDLNGGQYCVKGATNGFVYEGYLQYYKNDKLLKQVLVRKSKYLPQKQIVYVHAGLKMPNNQQNNL